MTYKLYSDVAVTVLDRQYDYMVNSTVNRHRLRPNAEVNTSRPSAADDYLWPTRTRRASDGRPCCSRSLAGLYRRHDAPFLSCSQCIFLIR